jgi:hypothetical protein
LVEYKYVFTSKCIWYTNQNLYFGRVRTEVISVKPEILSMSGTRVAARSLYQI